MQRAYEHSVSHVMAQKRDKDDQLLKHLLPGLWVRPIKRALPTWRLQYGC